MSPVQFPLATLCSFNVESQILSSRPEVKHLIRSLVAHVSMAIARTGATEATTLSTRASKFMLKHESTQLKKRPSAQCLANDN